MLIEHQHPDNKSITITVVGVPNAGKSTFINQFLGTDLSIVSSKAQTTRNKILCISTIDHTEIIFIDTPGLHRIAKELNKRLISEIKEAMTGPDLILFLIDLTKSLDAQWRELEAVFDGTTHLWIVFNKVDLPPPETLKASMDFFKKKKTEYEGKLSFKDLKSFYISAKVGNGMHELTGAICDAAKSGAHKFSDGSISNKSQRFFASEYIREQAFEFLREELPYELGVLIDDYQESEDEKDETQIHITASIVVNRPSQRAIVIGSQGAMIKKIGIYARKKIEAMTGTKVHLNLHVKVLEKWFNNNKILEQMDLYRAQDSKRVWRKK